MDESNSLTKHLVCSVEEAIKYGADGVSVHVNLGPHTEGKMLEDLGYVSQKCNEWGMPLLAMVYPRYLDETRPSGKKVVQNVSAITVAHSARLAAELGADIVKVPMLPDEKEFAKVVEGARIPVVIAGGSKLPVDKMLSLVEIARLAGAAGLSVGRNVFQDRAPDKLLKAFGAIFHHGQTAKEAKKILEEK
jgi:class I fructose-bisphosphate aldolase